MNCCYLMSHQCPKKKKRHWSNGAKSQWWREKDSNLRRRESADLQSAAIDRSAIPPPYALRASGGLRRTEDRLGLGASSEALAKEDK